MDLSDESGQAILRRYEEMRQSRKDAFEARRKGALQERETEPEDRVTEDSSECTKFLQWIFWYDLLEEGEIANLPLYPSEDGIEGKLKVARSDKAMFGFDISIELKDDAGRSEVLPLGSLLSSRHFFNPFNMIDVSKKSHGVFHREGDGFVSAGTAEGEKVIELLLEARQYQEDTMGPFAKAAASSR